MAFLKDDIADMADDAMLRLAALEGPRAIRRHQRVAVRGLLRRRSGRRRFGRSGRFFIRGVTPGGVGG